MEVEQIYGLIGYPLIHSFSKTFFNEKFESEKISAEYINFEISDISLLKEIIAEETRLRGLNVTIPYKEAVIPYLNEMDETARLIGAVNVIKFIQNKTDTQRIQFRHHRFYRFHKTPFDPATQICTHIRYGRGIQSRMARTRILGHYPDSGITYSQRRSPHIQRPHTRNNR